MKKNILIVFVLVSNFVAAQQYEVSSDMSADARNSIGKLTMFSTGAWLPGKPVDSQIEGTPYLFVNWDGYFELFNKTGKGYSLRNLNYNIQNQTLETKFSKDSVFIFDKKEIDLIKSNDRRFRFLNTNNNNRLCEVLYSSAKINFFKDFLLTKTTAQINPMTQQVISNAKYILKEIYLFSKTGDSNFLEINLKKKQILKLFSDKVEIVNKYASENNLDFSKEKDLIKVFRYYDTL